MEHKKTYTTLIIGIVLLAAGILFSFFAYRGSYSKSLELKGRISELEGQIKELQEQETQDQTESLASPEAEHQKLSEEKASLEKM